MKDPFTGEERIMNCHLNIDNAYICSDQSIPLKAGAKDLTTAQLIENICSAVALVLFGGLMSGLTVGLASIDRLSLEI